jgi:hypothetical protein
MYTSITCIHACMQIFKCPALDAFISDSRDYIPPNAPPQGYSAPAGPSAGPGTGRGDIVPARNVRHQETVGSSTGVVDARPGSAKVTRGLGLTCLQTGQEYSYSTEKGVGPCSPFASFLNASASSSNNDDNLPIKWR